MVIKILAYFMIPAYTVLFTKGYNWFTTNFSVIGNIFDKKLAFFVWGVMVGGYFYMIDRRIKSCLRLGRTASGLIPAALVLLFCAVTTPYLPEQLPLKSFLHIIFAFVSSVLLLLYLGAVIWKRQGLSPKVRRRFLAGLCSIIFISLVLLDMAGIISSALEIFVTLSTVILGERLTVRLRERPFSVGRAPSYPW